MLASSSALACILLASVLMCLDVEAQPIKIKAPPPQPAPSSNGKWIENRDPLDTLKINLGPQVNSPYSELFPIVTPDEQILYFTRKGSPQNAGYNVRQDDEDIWYSVRQPNGTWSLATRLEGPLNTELYDGVRSINRTNTHLYLQNIYRADGTRGKGFSISTKGSDGLWSFPEGLEIDDYYNDTNIAMMTVSNNEDFMILALQRKDTKGKHDLYMSRHIDGLHWSAPTPLTSINTSGDEISPFIAGDDRTLYFSTDGRQGYGSEDVYVCRRLDDTWLNWTEPKNIGTPINTPSFDAYFMLNGPGDTAYFSSAHESSTRGYGKSDLWKIGLTEQQRPGFSLPNAPAGDLSNSLLRLDGIYFDLDKAKLRPESVAVLARLLALMKQHPDLEIEVQGHTDNLSSAKYNQVLSQERALSVRQYLIDNGIDASRITAVGYGMTQPIAPNDTPLGRQMNRRVMVLIKKGGVVQNATGR